MLSNEQLWDEAQKFAQLLYGFTLEGEKGKTSFIIRVGALVATTTKANFMRALVDVMEQIPQKDQVEEIGRMVNKMERDEAADFLTLLKLHFTKMVTSR